MLLAEIDAAEARRRLASQGGDLRASLEDQGPTR
jgi:hypothetical protein